MQSHPNDYYLFGRVETKPECSSLSKACRGTKVPVFCHDNLKDYSKEQYQSDTFKQYFQCLAKLFGRFEGAKCQYRCPQYKRILRIGTGDVGHTKFECTHCTVKMKRFGSCHFLCPLFFQCCAVRLSAHLIPASPFSFFNRIN